MNIAEARKNLTDILARTYFTGERTDITKRNMPYAAIVTVSDKANLERVDDFMKQRGFNNKAELIKWLKDEIDWRRR